MTNALISFLLYFGIHLDERRSFDQARRKGFVEVLGSAWRSQRRDAPLLNSYRSLMDARGRPMIVLHKLSPNTSAGVDVQDRLVVDLSPLRLPEEFEAVGIELRQRVMSEMEIEGEVENYESNESLENEEEVTDDGEKNAEEPILDMGTTDNAWETRPLYQLPPYSLSWEVSRQQGKKLGKIIAELFDIPEKKATTSKKPKGVKPGKGRRHGGYGIG